MRRNRGRAHDWRRPSHRDGDASQASNGVGADGVGDRRRVVAARRARGNPSTKDDGSAETHFVLDVVSEKFQGMKQVARQRHVYSLLEEEFNEKGLRAANEHETPEEYEKTLIIRREKEESVVGVYQKGGGRREGFFSRPRSLLVVVFSRVDETSNGRRRREAYIYPWTRYCSIAKEGRVSRYASRVKCYEEW